MTIGPNSIGSREVFETFVDPEATGESSTLPALERLGRAGLLDLGTELPERLVIQFEVLSTLAEQSLSIAFSAWAHRMVAEYVAVDTSTPLYQELAPRLATAELVGSTAMAPALKANLGLGSVGLSGRRSAGSLVVDGAVAWASNLYPDRVVIVAAVEVDDGGHAVVALTPDTAGVASAPIPSLLALDATRSSSVVVDGARIPLDHVLSWDLAGFLSRVRPIFLILQTAFCVGLAAGSLREGGKVEATGFDTVLSEDRDHIEGEYRRVRSLALGVVRNPGESVVSDLIKLRLDAATLAQRAVGLEARLVGGRGYLASSGISRRYREAAFLPIQSPTEAQLRWELSCSG